MVDEVMKILVLFQGFDFHVKNDLTNGVDDSGYSNS